MGNLSEWSDYPRVFNENYIYFNYLLEYYVERDEYYNSLANAIGQVAQDRFNEIGSTYWNRTYDQRGEEKETIWHEVDKFKEIITFLNSAINYEQNTELQFLQEQKETLLRMFTKEEQERLNINQVLDGIKNYEQSIGQEKAADNFYRDFIIALNTILQGRNNTKAIISHEKTRLEKIDQAVAESIEAASSQIHGLFKDPKQEAHARETHLRKIQTHYLINCRLDDAGLSKRNKSHLGLNKRLKDLQPTISAKISEYLVEQIKLVLNSEELQQIILQKFQGGKLSDNDSATAIKNYIIEQLIANATDNVYKILYEHLQTNIFSEDILKEFSMRYTIDNLEYDKLASIGEVPKYFKDLEKKSNKRSASGLYEALVNILKKGENITSEQKTVKDKLYNGDKNKNLREIITLIEALSKKKAHYDDIVAAFNNADCQKYLNEFDNAIREISQNQKESVEVIFNHMSKSTKIQLVGKLAHDKNLLKNTNSSAATLEGFLNSLKAKVSVALKQQIDILINSPSVNTDDITKILRSGMSSIKVKLRAPTYDEIREGFHFQNVNNVLKLIWTGPTNEKTDFVIEMALKTDFNSISNRILKKATETAQEKLNKKLMELQQSYAESTREEIQNTIKEQIKQKNYHNQQQVIDTIENQRKKYNEAIQDFSKAKDLFDDKGKKIFDNILELLKQSGLEGEELTKVQRDILNMLINRISISNTAKTYNQYFNDIGFVGGKLGKGLVAQLQTLSTAFSAAGLTTNSLDMEQLANLIMNTSPYSVIGEKYKDPIEQYLGAMAGFVLFSEGGEEAKIIQQIYSDTQVINSDTSKKMHLYELNGTYYPGSMILVQIRNGIQNLITQMEGGIGKILSQKSGIMILNRVHPGMLPNRTSLRTKNPWTKMAEKAKKNIDLKVVFMGGLLDIIRNLNNAMENVPYIT